MEFLFKLRIHRGLLGAYYAYMDEFTTGQRLAAHFSQFCASSSE